MSAGINPAGPISVLETPPPAPTALPPAFGVFAQIRRIYDIPADSLQAYCESCGKLAGIVDMLKHYPPEELQKGYRTFIGMGGGWDDGNQISAEALFGDIPKALSPEHLASATRHLEEQLEKLRVIMEERQYPPDKFEECAKDFTATRKETFELHASGRHAEKTARNILDNFLRTLKDGLERDVLSIAVDKDTSDAPRITITFNTDEHKAEACHYSIPTDNGFYFGASEQIKMSLDAMKHNELLGEHATTVDTQSHFERDYTKYGGTITDSISVSSTDPFMDRLAKGAVRLLLEQHIRKTLKALCDMPDITEIRNARHGNNNTRIFEIAPPSRAEAQDIRAIADMRDELPEILPGIAVQKVGSKIRVELAEDAEPVLTEALAAKAATGRAR